MLLIFEDYPRSIVCNWKSVWQIKGTLMQIWKYCKCIANVSSSYKNNITQIAHNNTFHFLRYAHFRFVNLLTKIQKQKNTLKSSLHFKKKKQTLRVNNSKILRIQNAKFSGYHFYMDTKILRDFQICISLPLRTT